MKEWFRGALRRCPSLTLSATLKHTQHSRKLERKKKTQKGNEGRREVSLEQAIFIGGFREPRPE